MTTPPKEIWASRDHVGEYTTSPWQTGVWSENIEQIGSPKPSTLINSFRLTTKSHSLEMSAKDCAACRSANAEVSHE